MNRRDFIRIGAMGAAAVALPTSGAAPAPKFKTVLHKALIAKRFDSKLVASLKESGFPGVELSDPSISVEEARAVRAAAEREGLRIHSVMNGGWCAFNSPDASKRAESIERTKHALRVASAFGAGAVLVVPGRIPAPDIPAEKFDLEWDPRTLHLVRAVKGDNAPYADYIKAHNEAADATVAAVRELIPVAAEVGVAIALENVWNQLWVKPAFAAAFIRSFENPWVRAYLDLGNHVKYAPCEEWVRAFGPLAVKFHIKDFLVKRDAKRGGEFVPIGKGSIDWPSVRRTMDEMGCSGWVSIESGGWTNGEHSAIMDRFFAGLPVLA